MFKKIKTKYYKHLKGDLYNGKICNFYGNFNGSWILFGVFRILHASLILSICACGDDKWGDDGYYNPSESELRGTVKEAQDWIYEN